MTSVLMARVLVDAAVEASRTALVEPFKARVAIPHDEAERLRASAAVVAVLERLASGSGLEFLNGGDLQDLADEVREQGGAA